ncbi:alpha/beta hydrolase [Microbacterium sp. ASV49]|uniref:Alpha/beta hydrolase n=1 Tax=Microbacterium candidum TaxID=3041922 RepID=A0ABT7MVP8_9MICO|nr:alpha/beta hydrolase [Microbacterium sp. ASV49]MDL9978535.1 alpha/beta hydrolase [Microbacterium sp. ASV49]
MINDVSFPGAADTIRGRLYTHDEPRPAVVMAHGFSCTAFGMTADIYAAAFHEAGFAVLLFDHEGFGVSDGPRGVINRWMQLRGYEQAVAFARAHPSVSTVALWGDSFSGAVAIALAAFDPSIAALVVQVPASGTTYGSPDEGGQFEALREFARDADIGASRVGDPHPVVALSPEDVEPLLTDPSAVAWFGEYGMRPGSTWRNEARMGSLRAPAPFTMSILAPRVACPSLWVVADDDVMPGAEPFVSREAAAAAGGELMRIEGGHFGLLWEESPLLERVVDAEVEFLRRVLLPAR